MGYQDNKVEFTVAVKDDGLPGLKALTNGLDSAGAEAQELSRQAGAAVEQLRGVARQQQAVETLRNLAQEGRELGNKLGAASAEVDRLGTALQDAKTAQEQAGGATKESAKQIKDLEREYNAAVAAAKRASSAVGENQRAMDAARQAARDLGIDTSKLAAEKKRLEAAAAEARKGLDAVAASVERVRQREAEAAAVLQTFQGDLKKLGLEGPQAPAGLEQAFRKLGIDGVRKAEAAVHELQVALAQVRNSPDVLPADKKAAVAAFNEQVAKLRAEAGPAAQATGQLATAGDAAGNALGNAAHKALAWTGALVGLNQLQSLAGQVLEAGSAFENLEVRLTNLLGGTDAAARAMGMIKDLASTTPFEVTALAESFVKLTAFGMEPTEAQMRSLADVAANLGGGTEVLTGVTLALGQAWVKGKLQGEEIMQLAERGVPVWDALAAATGRTVPELQKMSEAGALGRDVIGRLIDELGRMNAGASDQLMNTYAGAVSNAKDALAEFFDMIAKSGAMEFLTEKIRELLVEFERMKETGELQQKAQEIAEGFVAVARTAEAVTRTLVDMAPAIEVAVKMWLAFKAVNIAASLYSIAAGAAVAAPAMVATGAGATTAATGMTAAAGAATVLNIALRRLLAATGVGLLLTAIGEIGLRLLGTGESAKKTQADVDAVFKPPVTNGPLEAAKAASQKLDELKEKAQLSGVELRKTFDAAVSSGKDVDQALREIGKDFDLKSVPGIQNAAVVLDGLVRDGRITAEQFRAAWDASLKGIDLSQFELKARAALDGTWQGVGRLQDALDAGLREAVRRSGKDFDLLSTGMGKAAESAINDTDTIIAGLSRLKGQGVDVGVALQSSLSKAISTADGQKAVDALRERIERMRTVLGEKVTDGLLSDLQKQAERLGATFEKLSEKAKTYADRVADAFKESGIKTQAELDSLAKDAEKRFLLISTSGKASADGVKQAWQQMAEASIAANGGVASETIKAEAAAYGLEVQVDRTGKTIVKAMGEGREQTNRYRDAVEDATKASRGLGDAIDREYANRMANKFAIDAETRALAAQAEQRRLGVDAEKFIVDAKGNRIVQEVNNRASAASKLESMGLDPQAAKKAAAMVYDERGNYTPKSSGAYRDGDTLEAVLARLASMANGTAGVGRGSMFTYEDGSRSYDVNNHMRENVEAGRHPWDDGGAFTGVGGSRSAQASGTPVGTSHTVTIKLGDTSRTINTASRSDADSLKDFLTSLGDARMSSQ